VGEYNTIMHRDKASIDGISGSLNLMASSGRSNDVVLKDLDANNGARKSAGNHAEKRFGVFVITGLLWYNFSYRARRWADVWLACHGLIHFLNAGKRQRIQKICNSANSLLH
jgi:hypothetical protein